MDAIRKALTDLERVVINAATEPTVVLWPTELAHIVGWDTRQSRDSVMAEVWRRSHYASFRAACGVLKPAVDKYPMVKTQEDLAVLRRVAPASEMQKVYAAKGRFMETHIVQLLSRRLGTDVTHRHTAFACRSAGVGAALQKCAPPRPPGPITDPGPYAIVGEIDGWTTDTNGTPLIFEVKTRFTGPPSSDISRAEWLQLQAYLNAHGVDTGLHVQCAFGSDELLVTTVARDDSTWRDVIVPALVAFVCEVRALFRGTPEDEPLRQRVLATTTPPPPAAPLPDRAITPPLPPPPPPPSPVELPPPLPLPSRKRKRPQNATMARAARELPMLILRSGKCVG